MVMREYRRHLPHQVPDGAVIFLTWNLKGAMPREVANRLRREREQMNKQPIRNGESQRDRSLRNAKLHFAKVDAFLDQAESGPTYLKDSEAAKIVEDAILYGVGERYELFAWCVMANHVHILCRPNWELPKVTMGLKGYTARAVNCMQGKVGRTFWQDESYNHWVRDEDELLRIIFYIENNPVKAGLCVRPEDWCWSSARFRGGWSNGLPFQLAEVVATDLPGLSG
jgi:REP-associated tyrosine transposase